MSINEFYLRRPLVLPKWRRHFLASKSSQWAFANSIFFGWPCWLCHRHCNSFWISEKEITKVGQTFVCVIFTASQNLISFEHWKNTSKKIGFNLYIIVTKWLMCLYLNTVPFEVRQVFSYNHTQYCFSLCLKTVFKMWDLIFYHGPHMIIEIALRLFAHNEAKLLEFEFEPEIVLFLNSQNERVFDLSVLLKVSCHSYSLNIFSKAYSPYLLIF